MRDSTILRVDRGLTWNSQLLCQGIVRFEKILDTDPLWNQCLTWKVLVPYDYLVAYVKFPLGDDGEGTIEILPALFPPLKFKIKNKELVHSLRHFHFSCYFFN